MPDSLRPEDVTAKTFRPGWRGYDPGQVDSFLREVSSAIASMQSENDRLRERLRNLGDRDMHAEFDRVSEELTTLLRGARETAEGMRSRAAVDAERITAEAIEDATRLRQDAWNDGVALLQAAQAESDSIIDEARRSALVTISEAERDGHRVLAKAKKDAEEASRRARLQGEQVLVEARARRDALVAEAETEVAAAKERVAVLMQRRDELLEQVDSLHGKIQELRSELEDRSAAIGKARAAETSTVRVLPSRPSSEVEPAPPSTEKKNEKKKQQEPWREGDESVRIVPPPKRLRPPSAEVDADAMAAEVRKLRVPPPKAAREEPVPDMRTAEPPEIVSSTEPEPQDSDLAASDEPGEAEVTPPKEVSVPEPAPTLAIEDLFASLRAATPATIEEPSEPPEEVTIVEAAAPAPPTGPDPFELRERLLLPVTNKTLRVVKRNLTEAQNIALDELRVQEDSWAPDETALEEVLADDLNELLERSVSAGWEAAVRMLGRDVPELDLQVDDSTAHEFAASIGAGVTKALDGAGEGPRRRAAAISRVYRAWRVDEAERRVRLLALGAYHDGLLGAFREAGVEAVRWVPAGRACVTCRAMIESGPVTPGELFAGETRRPPAHASCECTLVPA